MFLLSSFLNIGEKLRERGKKRKQNRKVRTFGISLDLLISLDSNQLDPIHVSATVRVMLWKVLAFDHMKPREDFLRK